MNKVTKLSDASKDTEEAHAKRVRQLFVDHPEIAKDAIIISPKCCVTLKPEHMLTVEVVGILEIAKSSILFAELMAHTCEHD